MTKADALYLRRQSIEDLEGVLCLALNELIVRANHNDLGADAVLAHVAHCLATGYARRLQHHQQLEAQALQQTNKRGEA